MKSLGAAACAASAVLQIQSHSSRATAQPASSLSCLSAQSQFLASP